MRCSDCTLQGWDNLGDGGLLLANFVDFDTIYGHRRDTVGYAAALEAFDKRLPELLGRLDDNDLLIITADHGCDPTWSGTDHTREQIPILVSHTRLYQPIGKRRGFFDVAATVAQHLDLPAQRHGTPFR
jgi:phosphopentomutase